MCIFSIGAVGLLAKYGHVQVIFKDLSDRRSERMSTMLGNYAILFFNRHQKKEALEPQLFFYVLYLLPQFGTYLKWCANQNINVFNHEATRSVWLKLKVSESGCKGIESSCLSKNECFQNKRYLASFSRPDFDNGGLVRYEKYGFNSICKFFFYFF